MMRPDFAASVTGVWRSDEENLQKRLAPCILDPVFSALGLDQFFESVKHAVLNASGQDICRILSASGVANDDTLYTKGSIAVLKSRVQAF